LFAKHLLINYFIDNTTVLRTETLEYEHIVSMYWRQYKRYKPAEHHPV